MTRQMADMTPDHCRECGSVAPDVIKLHGEFLCPDCAYIRRQEMDRDYALMDVLSVMNVLGGSRTWA
jgi:uncharacterized Zn finger protein (UPF0148 family)